MSDDGKKPPKGKKPTPFRVVKHPSTAKPSVDQVRQLFMASAFVEWGPFAQSMGWTNDLRDAYPVAEWCKAKREMLARRQAEAIGDAVFHHRGNWHSDVLKTLKEYPEAHDAMLGILKYRLNSIVQTINADQQSAKLAAVTGTTPSNGFGAIRSNELTALAVALKVVTEAKHKSLMIGDWSFKVAETFSDPQQFAASEDRAKSQEWKVTIMGGENMTSAQLTELIGKWYDRPKLPHQPEEVVAAASGDASGGG